MSYVKVTVDSGARSRLTDEQKKFFCDVAYLAQYTQGEIHAKCKDDDYPIFTYFGIAASVICADWLYKSEFGAHPVAQPIYNFTDEKDSQPGDEYSPELKDKQKKKWSHANNLALFQLEAHEEKFWRRPTILHTDGKVYKTFDTWGEFSQNFSDRVTWTHDYKEVLMKKSVYAQLEEMAKKEADPDLYCRETRDLVENYALMEFDRD